MQRGRIGLSLVQVVVSVVEKERESNKGVASSDTNGQLKACLRFQAVPFCEHTMDVCLVQEESLGSNAQSTS